MRHIRLREAGRTSGGRKLGQAVLEIVFLFVQGIWEWFTDRSHRRYGWRGFWLALILPVAVIGIIVTTLIALGI